eukprot:3542439-Pyramimonas_sp.AAC.1
MRELANGLEVAAPSERNAQHQGSISQKMRARRAGFRQVQRATVSRAAPELQLAEDRNSRLAAEAAAAVEQSEAAPLLKSQFNGQQS